MRILLLTQIVPYPPDSGPRIKTHNLLRYLGARGHQITLATFVRPSEIDGVQALTGACAAIHAVPLQRSRLTDARDYLRSLKDDGPFLVARDSKQEMHALIERITSETPFDIVHADQLTMGQYAQRAHSGARILDAHNAVWTIVERARSSASPLLRPILAMEARRLRRYEGALCSSMDRVLAVSTADYSKLVQAGAPADRISIVPISIDCEAYPPHLVRAVAANVVSVSTLYYPPNADGVRWFVREVYPTVRRARPDVTLTLIGSRPPHDLAAMNSRDGVTVTGYLPDVEPLLAAAALTIVPVRAASGMRVRILEALARGIPVVTTTTGIEGIDACHDKHVLIADDPNEFAAAVIRLLGDPALRGRLAAEGRKLVRSKYDWRAALPGVENAYSAALARASHAK